MKLVVTTVFVVGWLCAGIAANVSAASGEDVFKPYGETTMERLAVGNGITVTVQYGPDRAAWQILIALRRLLVKAKSPDPLMSSPGVSRVLRELLPLATRGKELDSSSVQVNGNSLLETDYEELSIRRICSSPSCISSTENQDLRTLVVFKPNVCPKEVE
jgi:hypothetical protein